jgi:hypothetical protein
MAQYITCYNTTKNQFIRGYIADDVDILTATRIVMSDSPTQAHVVKHSAKLGGAVQAYNIVNLNQWAFISVEKTTGEALPVRNQQPQKVYKLVDNDNHVYSAAQVPGSPENKAVFEQAFATKETNTRVAPMRAPAEEQADRDIEELKRELASKLEQKGQALDESNLVVNDKPLTTQEKRAAALAKARAAKVAKAKG